MNEQLNSRCNCTNCPGAGCQCGCQSTPSGLATAPMLATPPRCECGPSCACEGAEQGCLCH